MNREKIREEYSSGASLRELAKKYSVSYTALLRRSKKEKWLRNDPYGEIRRGIESLARLVLQISLGAEETGAIDPRDLKYLTAAEKELLELTTELDQNRREEATERLELKEIGSAPTGVIFIPEAD